VINIISVKKQKPGWSYGGGLSNTSVLPGKYYTLQGEKEGPALEDLADTQAISAFTGFGGKNFSWSANLSAHRAANHFIFEDSYGTTRRRERNEVWDLGASTAFAWDLKDQARIIANTGFYYGDKNIPGPMFSVDKGKQKDLSLRQNLMLNMPRAGHDNLSTEASLAYGWSSLGYEEPLTDSLHRLQSLTAINRWNWYVTPKLTLRISGDYRYNYIDSTNIGFQDSHEGGLSSAAEYAPIKKLLLVPSVKVIFNGPNIVPVPKFGLVWYAADFLTLKNNYYRSFKFPDFNDRFWAGDATARGNPDLKNEDGFGADLIVEYRQKKLFTLESAFYTEWMRDSIHWRSLLGVWEPQNVGEAAFFGWDSRIRSDFSDWFILSFSYQYLLSYVLTGDLTFASDIRMPYMPAHTIGGAVELRWKTKSKTAVGSVTLNGLYEGMRYTETLNISRIEPRFILNLLLNQKTGRNLTIFTAVHNILNASYVSSQGYPMPGISMTLGLRANFEPKPGETK
jgi:vitamin B12 transporter